MAKENHTTDHCTVESESIIISSVILRIVQGLFKTAVTKKQDDNHKKIPNVLSSWYRHYFYTLCAEHLFITFHLMSNEKTYGPSLHFFFLLKSYPFCFHICNCNWYCHCITAGNWQVLHVLHLFTCFATKTCKIHRNFNLIFRVTKSSWEWFGSKPHFIWSFVTVIHQIKNIWNLIFYIG